MTLLLACCRWPASLDRDEAVRAASMDADWQRLLELARRHRVQGLVHDALSRADVVPTTPIAETLRDDARRIATRNLQLAGESVRLVRRLERASVPVMVVKGAALASLAYGTLTTKMAWDIDLLVAADMIDAAADTMMEAGYSCTLPGPDRAMLASWHRFSKESVWARAGVHVELHSSLADSPSVLPSITARSPVKRIAVASGMTLPTLGRDELFAYLCVHGAASGWRRAKWLADLCALLAGSDHAETQRLYMAAHQLGAGRAAGQALLLGHRYLALPVPRDLLWDIRRDACTRWTAAIAGWLMTRAGGFDDPAETAFGTVPIHLMQMTILPGWRYALGEWRRKATPDPRFSPPSRSWRWLHPIATIVRRISRAQVVRTAPDPDRLDR